MKRYIDLQSTDRAFLLWQLFPDSVENFFRFLYDVANVISEAPERSFHEMQPGYSYERFTEVLADVQTWLHLYDENKDITGLIRLLFTADSEIFVVYYLIRYVTVISHPDEKFVSGTLFLFSHPQI